MLINFERQKLTIGELKSGKINENILSPPELEVVKFMKSWVDGQEFFSIQSSGSTGSPKEIRLSRAILTYSASTSLQYLDPQQKLKNTLLCIDPRYIGGKMVLIRAMLRDLNLTVTPPGSHLSILQSQGPFDLTSLVPLHVQHLLNHHPERLQQLKTVLVGGAPLQPEDVERLGRFPKVTFYHTYGMTETASHIALKNLSAQSEEFEALGDIVLGLDDRGCLRIKGTVTGGTWLQTNDVVELRGTRRFSWIGRADFVINSGGVKVHPEQVEASLAGLITTPYFVAGIPDRQLGEKVVLLIESDSLPSLDFDNLPKYHRPRAVYHLDRFVYTPSGKINRPLTLQKALE